RFQPRIGPPTTAHGGRRQLQSPTILRFAQKVHLELCGLFIFAARAKLVLHHLEVAPMVHAAVASIVAPESGLVRYLAEILRLPMLEADEEFMLAKRLREHGDGTAAHKLITSHLRLVAKIAMGYRGYGLPIAEVISEGNVGLMQAVKRFDPDRGFRLATYAMWWIKAAIQGYILRSWSLVKMGTTANQRKLFFNLRKA